MYRFILALSKIAHQMWHHHPFSQRNRTTWIDDRKLGGVDKVAEGQTGNIVGLHKIGLAAPITAIFEKFHPPHPPFYEGERGFIFWEKEHLLSNITKGSV